MDEVRMQAIALAREGGQIALDYQSRVGTLRVGSKGRLDFVTRADREVEAAIVAGIRHRYPDDGVLAEEDHDAAGSSGRTWVVDPIDGTHNFIRGMPSWAVSIGVVADGRPVAGVIHAPVQKLTLSATASGGAYINGEPLPRRPDLAAGEANIVFAGVSTTLGSAVDRWMSTFIRDELGMAERRLGSATSGLLAVLRGHGDLYIGFGESVWDVAGGAVILEAAGHAHTFDWAQGLPRGKMTFLCGQPDLVARTHAAIAAAGISSR